MINSLTMPFRGTLFSTDLDETLVHQTNYGYRLKSVEDRKYDLEAIRKVEDSVKNNGIDEVMINTGRDLSELREIKDILTTTTLPITTISIQDGKRIFKKPQTLTSSQWMDLMLTDKINPIAFEDKNWRADYQAPLKMIGDFLLSKGFVHKRDDGEKIIYSKPIERKDEGVNKIYSNARWEVILTPPGVDFTVKAKHIHEFDDVDIGAFNKKLSREIEAHLTKQGYKFNWGNSKKEISYVNSLERADIHKGASSDYIRSQRPDITGEIRAGDGLNDLDFLKTNTPNTQVIQVGVNPYLSQYISKCANVTYVDNGELYKGINEACKKLDLSA